MITAHVVSLWYLTGCFQHEHYGSCPSYEQPDKNSKHNPQLTLLGIAAHVWLVWGAYLGQQLI